MDDLQLWIKIQDGDVEAFRILHDKYYSQLWLWAGKLSNDSALSEELVSDCFISLWTNRKSIHIEKSVKSYIFLMLRNQFISHLRKSKKLPVAVSSKIPDIPDEAALSDLDFYADLYKALKKLPEKRREILELAVYESMTYKEIAMKLKISVNTVKTQMGRSYQFLKTELDPINFILFCLFGNSKSN